MILLCASPAKWWKMCVNYEQTVQLDMYATGQFLLEVLRFRLNLKVVRFLAAPKLWNSLAPSDMLTAQTIETFKSMIQDFSFYCDTDYKSWTVSGSSSKSTWWFIFLHQEIFAVVLEGRRRKRWCMSPQKMQVTEQCIRWNKVVCTVFIVKFNSFIFCYFFLFNSDRKIFFC